uniref:Rhodanese domain-containing protein n=1 Tax=Laticauda laticaudata TaxID=8630 RepID=A0A8C5RDF1_LATLA
MRGGAGVLGQFTFGLITQLAASRLSGCGETEVSQLTWSPGRASCIDPNRRRLPSRRFCPSGYTKNRKQIVCHFCTAEDHSVSYQQLKDLLESKTVRLIDVREKWEIAEHGKIPGSISIPCKLLLSISEQGKKQTKVQLIVYKGKTWNNLMCGTFGTWICAAGQLLPSRKVK